MDDLNRRPSGPEGLMESVYKDMVKKEASHALHVNSASGDKSSPRPDSMAHTSDSSLVSEENDFDSTPENIRKTSVSHTDLTENTVAPISSIRPISHVITRQASSSLSARRMTLPAKSMLSISSVSVVSSAKGNHQDDQSLARSLRVNNKRQTRVNEHLQNYIRINVVIDKSIKLLVVIDVRHTVGYLSKSIEAEYCHRYMQEPQRDGMKRWSNQSKFMFECGPIYNDKIHELRFDTIIKNSISMDDTIQVSNVFQTEDTKTFSGISNNFSTIDGFNAKGSTDFSSSTSTSIGKKMAKSPSENFVYQRMPISDSNNEFVSFDDKFKIMLANRLFLCCFMEFCVSQMCAESLLFYIDVEIYQSCVNPLQKARFAYYIYQVYIAVGAPLQINLTDDICDEIRVPALKNINDIDALVYDEAQQYIFTSLKFHTFESFSKSIEYAEFVTKTREEYNLAQLRGSYFSEFYFDDETVSEFLKAFDRNAPSNEAASAATHRLHVSRPFRDALMQESLLRLFPDIKLASENYFECLENLMKEEKKSRIVKEKKMRKFFGDQPTAVQMNYQAPYNAKSNNKGLVMFKPSIVNSVPLEDIVSEDEASLMARKKQVKKLHGFFGDINFTKDLDSDTSTKSLLVETPSYSLGDILQGDDAEHALPVLSNDSNNLDKKVKMQLSRTRMKIVQVMGGDVNDELIVKMQTGNVTRLNAELVAEDDSKSDASEVSNADSGDELETTREVRIKRLHKLRQYLGEKVTEADMGASSPHDSVSNLKRQMFHDSVSSSLEAETMSVSKNDTSPEAKTLQMKRSKKLGHMFGELPPPKMIHTPEVHVLNTNRHRLSISGLESFKNKNNEEVLDFANKFFSLDCIEEDSPPSSPDCYTQPDTDFGSKVDLANLTAQKEKSMRKKKSDKLKNFFGDNTDVGSILEHAMIEDIARDIEEDMRELVDLKANLERIKAGLKARTGFEMGELEDAMKKMNARGKRVYKEHGKGSAGAADKTQSNEREAVADAVV